MTIKPRFVHIFCADSEYEGCRLRGDFLPESQGQNRVHCIHGDGNLMDYPHQLLPFAHPLRHLQFCKVTPDLNMPRKGERLAPEEIKSNNCLPCLPMVILATSGEPQDIQCSYERGIHAFISNPINFFGLHEIAKNLARDWLALSSSLLRPVSHE